MKILIASPIYKDALERLREENDVVTAFDAGAEELKDRIVDREVLVFRSGVDITADVMSCFQSSSRAESTYMGARSSIRSNEICLTSSAL